MKTKAKSSTTDSLRFVHFSGVGVCVLILAAASALGVVPTLKSHASDREVRERFSRVSQELDGISGEHAALSGRLESMRSEVERREVPLSQADGINRLMAELTDMFESMGFVLLTLQPRPAEPGEPLSSIPIQVALQGDLQQALDLFGRLHRERPDIHVRGLTMEHAGPDNVQVRAQFRWLVLEN